MPLDELFARKVVLVVEDDDDLRHIFRDALIAAGFRTREASDGTDALRMIDLDPPDAIVLDLLLPSLDGVSLLDEITARTDLQHIPVVVVTGSKQLLDGHATALVLRKPVSPIHLVEALRRRIAEYEARHAVR